MRRLDVLFLILPAWLMPYRGAQVVAHTELASRSEVSYISDAKPVEVLSYYQHLIAGAGLPFLPAFDGIGTSIRVAATECDLLIKIREQETGTLTQVSCATKSAGPPKAVEVIPSSSRPRTMEERIREGEEKTRRVLAEAQAKHKKGIDGMKAYDEPVDARARKKQPGK